MTPKVLSTQNTIKMIKSINKEKELKLQRKTHQHQMSLDNPKVANCIEEEPRLKLSYTNTQLL